MIPRVRPRSANVGDALRYLFGPGDDGEHHDQRLVGAWEAATVRGICDLQPQKSNGVWSVAQLAGLLEQPVLAGNNPPRKPVWHCSLHNHAEDPVLTDAQWGQVAADFLDGVGLAPVGDPAAVRWVAVRHAADHVHLVVTLVRQDGRNRWIRYDFRRSQTAARAIESRLGLRAGGPARTPAGTGHG
ncbi:relaxase/mobilization nuclease domain-containing protein [Paractinoplanes rishiriensis]|uniref:MobA/VirD2-like nuclease domain-containing protein n=1 Tax=Paractinoplanes rishiriensis TaxID=1050105 RepID=A0A919JSU5_9ACTN|nr:hypothetical protein [Actinoplanes rishiriensis]GIE92819.1 hypothetical protein Ari01nite_02840 [Actinoplanes rishiriensis]